MYRFLFSPKLSCRILRHMVLFFSMVLLFTWVTCSRSDRSSHFLQYFLLVSLNAVFFFGYAYLTAYLLIPFFLVRRRFLAFFLLFIAVGFGLSLLKFKASDFLFYSSIAPENQRAISGLSMSGILVNTKDMTFIVAIFAIAKYAKDHYVLQSNIHELEEKRLWAEIKLLDYHLDPHVIFNNFNSLYSISIYKKAYLAPTVRKLRSILYYLFRESRLEKIPLVREIDMIENYIGLEQLRYGERLQVTFAAEGNFQNLRITPLILYSFVENCFVHGAGEDTSNSWIDIRLAVQGSHLEFRAANSVSGYSREQKGCSANISQDVTIRRLELQYPSDHRLAIHDKRNEYVVELNMNL
jgi:hypothetical protein